MDAPTRLPDLDALPLRFDNRFVRELPGDPSGAPHPRQVHGACYSRVQPRRASAPQLLAHAAEVAELLGLDAAAVAAPAFAEVFAGNRQLPGMDPYAMCYGGHQFGQWAGQLGDGRAINLGEVVNARGERWALQLKGAGRTPYARSADGLAVLRSSVREFLCSEAMHHLGVPTTRALSLVTTGDPVLRDMFYDGNPRHEPGAVVCRVAPSFTRFGNFQIFASRGDLENLRRLADYTLATDFPHLGPPSPATYLAWFDEVCRRTAETVVHWMRVGFVHGVMNTDNMSILGLTIDYGPYGWLEDYDPAWTPNTTDAEGRRYRFGAQPQVAQWNLWQLANALAPLVDDTEGLTASLEAFVGHYESGWRAMLAGKLGLQAFDPAGDTALVEELHGVLQQVETDMTLFYRGLAEVPAAPAADDAEALSAPLADAWYRPEQVDAGYRQRLASWLDAYRARVRRDGTPDAERRERMHAVNPKYVLRNYLAQQAIDLAEQGDGSLVVELLDVLRRPYDEQPGNERFAQKRPEWARHKPGCSMLSCSS
ncbi:MAG TPA: YdiU family protein [Gammaproteobacteria bacterium]